MGVLRCHNCQTQLSVGDETLDHDISCPTCGSISPLSSAPAQKHEPTRTTIGRFQLLEPVGKGQFGTVWRARDTRLERIVALKIPRKDDLTTHTRNMFLREANAAATLNHPNVVRVFEVFEDEGQIYIVSEFINGDDLKLTLLGNGFSNFAEVARFMLAVAEGVHHAHSRGIIHRDLKPANILVDGVQQPHITDFGLAKIDSHNSTMTVEGGQPVGTISYMAPEQAAGVVHELDARSDVFSLGVILYEMLVGQRPFPGVTDDVMTRIQTDDPIKPRQHKPNLPRDLETICLKALMKAPNRRYQTAQDLADDLGRFLAGQPTLARPISKLEIGARWLRKNLKITAVSAVAMLSIAAAAMSFYPKQNLVELATNPPGAAIAFFPLDPVTGEPQVEKVIRSFRRTPVSIHLPPADYLVVAKLDDGRFHEVYRHVPHDPKRTTELYPHRSWKFERGRLHLPTIYIPRLDVIDGMARFSGCKEFGIGNRDEHGEPQLKRDIAAFCVDTHEATIEDFCQAFPGGLPGNLGPVEPKSNQLPMTDTIYEYAVWYAELKGKRLPTEYEFEFAARNGGATKYPWGEHEQLIPSELCPVGTWEVDRTQTDPPVYGLLSNGGEFTGTRFQLNFGKDRNLPVLQLQAPEHVVLLSISSEVPLNYGVTIRGAAEAQIASPHHRIGHPRSGQGTTIGFRCARSAAPRW